MGKIDEQAFSDQLASYLGYRKDFYPVVLEMRFPHVLQRLVALWETDGMETFLRSLTLPQSSGNQGFPADALAEILEIKKVYADWRQSQIKLTETSPFGHLFDLDLLSANEDDKASNNEALTDSTILLEKVSALRRGL